MATLTSLLPQFTLKLFAPPQTEDEKEDAELRKQEAKMKKLFRQEQRREVKYLAKQIPVWLANMGLAYWLPKSDRKGVVGNKFKPVRFDRIQIGEDGYYFRINTRRLPRGVLVPHLKDEKVLETLTKQCSSSVRVHDEPSGLWYSVETAYGRGSIPDFVGYAEMMKLLPNDAPPMVFPVGLGENKKPLFCDLDKTYTLLIGGAKGTGKSNEANGMLCTLITRNSPQKLRLFLTDLKGGIEFYDYGGIPHLGGDVYPLRKKGEDEQPPDGKKRKKHYAELIDVAPAGHKLKPGQELTPPLGQDVVTEPGDVLPVLQYCQSEMERRTRLIAPSGAKNILTYNRKFPDKALSHWLIVIDELATLIEHPEHKKEALMRLSELARKGRAAGIYMVMATQNPESHIVPGQISANMDARLAFRTGSGNASGVLLGDGKYDAARLPPVPGRVIWKWGTETIQVQTPFLAESAMRGIVRDVKAGKIVDAHEAELKQKADFLFQQALALNGGECQSGKLYKFLKGDGYRKSEVGLILDRYEVKQLPDGLGPEIVIDNTPYYLCPPIIPKRIPRHLVPVADVQAGRHPNPDYNYSMTHLASRLPPTENSEGAVSTDPENPEGQAENEPIEQSADLPNSAPEPEENMEIADSDIELSVWDAYSDEPGDDDDLPEWLRGD